MAKTSNSKTQDNGTLEQKLWKSADKLRKNMDAAEYKHIVLGLIFLKYISDSFEELHQKWPVQTGLGAQRQVGVGRQAERHGHRRTCDAPAEPRSPPLGPNERER